MAPVACHSAVHKGRFRSLVGVLLGIALAASVVGTFWPVLAARAVAMDDDLYLKDNPAVQNPGLRSAGRILGEVLAPSRVVGYYQPLSIITLMIDYAAGGRIDNLRPFHRTSLALHSANVVLVLLLLNSLFAHLWPAALLALLFGLHPLTIEPVAWVGERKTLLSTFFALWCLLLYVRAVKNRAGGDVALRALARNPVYLGSVAACLLAMMSKPTSVPLPLLLLVLDFWPLQRLTGRRPMTAGVPLRQLVLEKLPFFALAAVFALITMISTARTSGVSLPAAEAALRGPLMVCHTLAFYFAKIAWPARLTPVYPPVDPPGLGNPRVFASLVAVAAIALVAVVSLRRTRAVAAGLLFFSLALLPTLGFVGWSWVTVSDKYVYLPALGLVMMGGALLVRLWRQRHTRIASSVVVAALAIGYATASRAQIARWQTTENLYRHMLDIHPRSPRLHNDLATEFVAQGRFAEAAEHARRAVEILPTYALGRYNLAVALLQLGRADEAEPQLREAVALAAGFAEARNNLGVVLLQRGDAAGAIEQFRRAVQARPGFADAWYNLGTTLARLGRIDEAMAEFRRGLSVLPGEPSLEKGLASAMQQKRPIGATP